MPTLQLFRFVRKQTNKTVLKRIFFSQTQTDEHCQKELKFESWGAGAKISKVVNGKQTQIQPINYRCTSCHVILNSTSRDIDLAHNVEWYEQRKTNKHLKNRQKLQPKQT